MKIRRQHGINLNIDPDQH